MTKVFSAARHHFSRDSIDAERCEQLIKASLEEEPKDEKNGSKGVTLLPQPPCARVLSLPSATLAHNTALISTIGTVMSLC